MIGSTQEIDGEKEMEQEETGKAWHSSTVNRICSRYGIQIAIPASFNSFRAKPGLKTAACHVNEAIPR